MSMLRGFRAILASPKVESRRATLAELSGTACARRRVQRHGRVVLPRFHRAPAARARSTEQYVPHGAMGCADSNWMGHALRPPWSETDDERANRADLGARRRRGHAHAIAAS